MAEFHPTAIVEAGAEIAETVKIGPFCHVGEQVKLAADVELLSHVVIAGDTEIGEGTSEVQRMVIARSLGF